MSATVNECKANEQVHRAAKTQLQAWFTVKTTNTLCHETQGLLRIQWAPHIFLFFMLHVNKMKLSVSENEELGNKTLFCQTGSATT